MTPEIDLVELAITIAFLTGGAALAGSMIWLERKPRQNLDTRMIPTTPVLLVGVLIGLVAAVHLINTLGIHTGRR